MHWRRSVIALLAALTLPAADASAKHRVTSRAKLIDPTTMSKLLERGEVALVESNADGTSKQVVLFQKIDADPKKVYNTVLDVEAYPKFFKTVTGMKVLKRKGKIFSFKWELDVPVLTLKGTRAVRAGRGVIDIRGVSGHFKESRERWEFFPLDGGKRTLAVFYRALDLENGGMLLKAMVDIEPALPQSIAVATGFVSIRSFKRYIEQTPERVPKAKTGPVPPFERVNLEALGVNMKKLNALLELGLLALIESHKDGSLRQVALLTKAKAPRDKMLAIIKAPEKYPEFIPNFVSQKATPKGKNKLRLNWELEVPLFNLEGTSEMTFSADDCVDVVSVDGDVKRGRWRWEVRASGEHSIPIHYAYTDVRESSWILKQAIEKQPLVEHGSVIASASIALLAMKMRAEGKR